MQWRYHKIQMTIYSVRKWVHGRNNPVKENVEDLPGLQSNPLFGLSNLSFYSYFNLQILHKSGKKW
jgi:hypothetical protein